MQEKLERDVFDAKLPQASCKRSTRCKIEAIAKERGISNAQVMRFAVEFFLQNGFPDGNSNNIKMRTVQP